jgi:hypothetical protein
MSSEGVTVDSSGALYASGNRRVIKFTSAGAFVFMVGRNVNKTKEAEVGATQAEKDICTAASGDTCGQAASGAAANEFSGTSMPLAVDSAGVVWVGDNERLISFDPAGAPGAEIALPGGGDTKSLVIDSSDDFFVKSESLSGVRKLEAGTGTLLETLDETGQPRPVTLDEDDNLYVGDTTSPYRFKVYNPAGEQIFQFGAGQVIGQPGGGSFGTNAIAVGDAAGRLYVASSGTNEAESVVQAFPLPEPGPLVEDQGFEDIEPTTATLTATINPENSQTTYRFEYGSDESYGESTPAQTLAAEEFEAEDVAVGIEELIPDTTYHFRVLAENECEPLANPGHICTATGPDQTFTTLPAVGIEAQWATDVTAHTAELHAEMDPLGVEAEAWLEYGTSEAYGHLVPLANLGNGFGPVGREAFLSGLAAGTTYHYRFVGRDERDGNVYTVNGADRTFVTQLSGLGFQLADGRAWEMVSPPDKHGATLIRGEVGDLQASADGNGIAYQSKLSTEADPEGNRIIESSMNLARRAPDGSWRSKDLTLPNDRATGYVPGSAGEYLLFSSDLSQSLTESMSGTPLSPEASAERTLYLRQNTEPGTFRPLVTSKEPYANVPPGTEFGGNVSVAGVSPDFRHFALVSEGPLVEGAPAFPNQSLSEWSDGQIRPVSVLPAGEGGTIVSAKFVGSGLGSVRGAVSEGGARVFWSRELSGKIGALYVRDTEAGESGRLDVVQSGDGTGAAEPVFQGASADGSAIFFTDSQQLTEDASAKKSDLYRCELPPGSVASGCATLTDLSIPVKASEKAEVLGLAPGIAEDGDAIYFVARGVLDEAPNELGESAASGQPNLYFWRQGEATRFIATLSQEDETDWGSPPSVGLGEGRNLSAASSPSGHYLAFMSKRSLTGYDSRDTASGEAAQEVFLYDSAADSLQCASCHPTGARPHSALPPPRASLANPMGFWEEQQVAGALPEAIRLSLGHPTFSRPRAILDNGRVFFNAIDSLVPADSNGQWDVYQYESTGAGDCSVSSGGSAISRSGEGCVSLLSSGTAEEEAAFFDASETGDDAFFWTPAQLNETDTDHELDIYDARVNGIPATLPKISECLGEACQPAAQAPNDPTPASAAFRGRGNLKAAARKRCPKGKRAVNRRGKSRCVSRKQKHKRHQRRAHNGRRAQR